MKKRRSLIAALLAAAMLVCTFALSLPVTAADAGDDYTVTVGFNENIRIVYDVIYPADGLKHYVADIPIGGTSASSQVYCADPFVPFHSMADTVNYIDTMSGYVSAAPWTVSGAMRLNEKAVRWLVLNGYRGDFFAADDPVSQASVTRLQSLYPDIATNIDKTVALMATKIAIWKVVANDGVVYISTSLDDTPRGDALDALVEALVRDAKDGRNTDVPSTEMTLEILYDGASDVIYDKDSIYYGPLRVAATIKDSTNPANVPLDGVLIDVMGEDIGGIEVTSDTSSTRLEMMKVFGTAEQQAYRLGSGEFTKDSVSGDGKWTSKAFYLMIPKDRTDGKDELTVRARAKATDVPLLAGTPITYVYANEAGVQNWNYVQGFTGGSDDGVEADLYAEGIWSTGVTPTGEIYVQKTVVNGEYGDGERSYTFQLRYSTSQNFAYSTVVDLGRYPVRNASTVDIESDTFTLTKGQLAYVEGLPADRYYWVVETGVNVGLFDTSYNIYPGEPRTGGAGTTSDVFQMEDEQALVTFTNTYKIPKIDFYIAKAAMEYTYGQEEPANTEIGGTYTFRLESSADGGTTWTPVNMSGVTLHYDDRTLNAGDNTGQFILNSPEMVSFSLPLPPEQPDVLYRVVEIKRDQSLMVGYEGVIIRAGSEGAEGLNGGGMTYAGDEHATDAISIGGTGGTCYIAFANVNYIIDLHRLSITKTVRGDSADADGALFPFTLSIVDPTSGLPIKVPLSATPSTYAPLVMGTHITPDRIKNDADGQPTVLLLADGETAHIMGIPLGNYEVSEGSVDGERYHTWYNVGADDTERYSSTAKISIADDTSLTFINEVRRPVTSSPPDNPPNNPNPRGPTITPITTPSPSPSATPTVTPGTTPRPSASPTDEEPEEPGIAPAPTPRVSPARTPRVSPAWTPRIPSTTEPALSATPTPTVGPDGRDIGDDGPGTGVPDISPAPDGATPDISPAPTPAPGTSMPKTGGTGSGPELTIPLLTGAVCLALAAIYGRRGRSGPKKRRG